ncbi:MAG: hypothetical protein ICV68_03360 [Pyrinomonadaceae bacterium]|nr:hypothetical protein [Pyrinomonadaceae bacterium]
MVNEDTTQDMGGSRPFEERVLAKLESIDARLKLLERRDYDTKPIWERALKEIVAVKQSLTGLERKIDVLGKDMLTLRADQVGIETRLSKLEGRDENNILTTR